MYSSYGNKQVLVGGTEYVDSKAELKVSCAS